MIYEGKISERPGMPPCCTLGVRSECIYAIMIINFIYKRAETFDE